MVVALGPGKFYGSSLPRPRMMLMNRSAEEEDIYMKERVDPPLGVMDPLLTWAHEAHWSMGGLSFNRFKLQGKIEGNVKKLRSQQKKKLQAIKNSLINSKSKKTTPVRVSDLHHSSSPSSASPSPSPPPAPMATKRRRRLAHLLDDEEDNVNDNNKSSDPIVEEDEDVSGINRSSSRRLFGGSKPKRARKLADDFDRVASSESESSANTIQSSPSSLVKSPNTKKNQSITKEGRILSSRTCARKISPEKEAVEEETTPATTASGVKKAPDMLKPVLRSKSKANDVAGDARKKSGKNTSTVTPPPPTEVRTSRRLRSSPTV